MSEDKSNSEISIRWDDSDAHVTYANIFNVVSSREEVTLMVGMNQRLDTENNELVIKLSDKIIFNPFAAKRMTQAMNSLIEQYEAKFGEINLGESDVAEAQPEAPAKKK